MFNLPSPKLIYKLKPSADFDGGLWYPTVISELNGEFYEKRRMDVGYKEEHHAQATANFIAEGMKGLLRVYLLSHLPD